MPPYIVCKKGMSRSFQVVNIFQRRTVFENVQVSVLAREKKTWNLFTPAKRLVRGETEHILESRGPYREKR